METLKFKLRHLLGKSTWGEIQHQDVLRINPDLQSIFISPENKTLRIIWQRKQGEVWEATPKYENKSLKKLLCQAIWDLSHRGSLTINQASTILGDQNLPVIGLQQVFQTQTIFSQPQVTFSVSDHPSSEPSSPPNQS